MAYYNTGLKASGENAISVGSDAWNIADGYTKIKILRLIIQLDIDEEIALFGKKEDTEQLSSEDIPYKRVESFDKFIFHLKQLIGNCQFAIDRKVDELIIQGFLNRIEQVEKVSDGIADTMINDVTKENTLKINEEHFRKCFSTLQKIKNELNFPVNRAGLIFRQGDELDLDAMMRTIEEGGG